MQTVRFRVYGLPQTKGSAKGFVIPGKFGKKARAIITNDNTKNKGWAQTVSGEAQRHRLATCPWSGPIALMLVFFMPIPKSLPKRAPQFMVKKPDLDKMVRSVKDALKGVMYEDDRQVVDMDTHKVYAESPGVWIQVSELTLADDAAGMHTYLRGRRTLFDLGLDEEKRRQEA